jgi:hypothetical protein
MTQAIRNVKGKLTRLNDRVQKWFADHPKTLAWVAFWLFLNYVLDFVSGLFF